MYYYLIKKINKILTFIRIVIKIVKLFVIFFKLLLLILLNTVSLFIIVFTLSKVIMSTISVILLKSYYLLIFLLKINL